MKKEWLEQARLRPPPGAITGPAFTGSPTLTSWSCSRMAGSFTLASSSANAVAVPVPGDQAPSLPSAVPVSVGQAASIKNSATIKATSQLRELPQQPRPPEAPSGADSCRVGRFPGPRTAAGRRSKVQTVTPQLGTVFPGKPARFVARPSWSTLASKFAGALSPPTYIVCTVRNNIMVRFYL